MSLTDSRLECASCGRPAYEHCKVHMMPCCPGTCPGEVSKYAYKSYQAHQHAPIIRALTEYVEAIRYAGITRTGQNERRVQECARRLHDEVHAYAYASATK